MKKTALSTAIKAQITLCAMVSTPFLYAQNSSEEIVEEVIVTGSRIIRPNLSQPAPVTRISSEDIKLGATPDLASILAETPAIGATDTLIGNNNNNALAGLSSADLRRLGSERTLVLVDGKRHVAGAAATAQVDLGTIPAGLIENVDIVTGGTSAVYGSDAVSGVINIIKKKDYEGFELQTSSSRSTEGVDAQNTQISFLAGTNFLNEKANITFYADYADFKETLSPDLLQLNSWGTIVNPDNTGEDDGIPDRIRVPNVLSEFISRTGVLNPFSGTPQRWTFDEAGNPLIQTERAGENSFAFGNFPNGCAFCFSTEQYENYQPGLQRFNLASTFNLEINESLRFYYDAKYVESDITQQFQPTFRFGNVSINVADNPYLNEGLRQQLMDAGVSNARFAKFFDELGNRTANNLRTTERFVSGITGDFSLANTEFNYEFFYGYGATDNNRKTLNDLITGNLSAALDAVINPDTGEIDCRANIISVQPDGYQNPATVDSENCVPYNPFGLNQASAAARDWVSADVTREDKISQRYFGGHVTFDSENFFNLQGGPVSFAVGFEYRKEKSKSVSDALTKKDVLTTAATPDSMGKFSVEEYYIEANLPILADLNWANELTLDLAFRAADYNPFGKTEAYKMGFLYAPIEDLKLRATWGKAVRAPNIDEAFRPISPGFARVSDPCDADNINDDPDRAANCAALGIPSGFQANDNVSVSTLSGGNPNLEPEKSDSITGGFVWTPSYIEGLSLTIDYYDIEIEDAILQVRAQDIVDNCVDATGGPDSTFCSQVTRDATTHDVSLVSSGFLNASSFIARGVDLQAQYIWDLESIKLPGELTLSLTGNRLIQLDIFEFQNRPDEINKERGEVGDPKWQYSLRLKYEYEDLTVNWATRHIAKAATFDVSPNGETPEDRSPAFISDIRTSDISFNYAFSDNFSATLGMRNIFNRLPPGYTVNPLYDLVGRRAFFNASYKF